MSDYRANALTNQNEYGCPETSSYGQAFRQALASGLNESILTNVTAATYLFRGFWGKFASAPPGKAITIAGRSGGYQGELPLDQQPFLEKPRPWKNER